MNQIIRLFSIFVILFAIWLFVIYAITGYIDSGLVVIALFGVGFTVVAIYAWKEISWRVHNGVDVFATLETDPETVKNLMLITMRHGHADGIKGAFKEFNEIFRNYPQWRLQDWVVFRSWYKNVIDQAVKFPDVYKLEFKDGTMPYSKEQDPMYDPDAPDWEQFNPYYDDDDNDDFDDYDNSDGKFRKEAEDGFYTGLGIGAADDMLNK